MNPFDPEGNAFCLAETTTHALHQDKIETATERDNRKKPAGNKERERASENE